jgi:hypothetical protein
LMLKRLYSNSSNNGETERLDELWTQWNRTQPMFFEFGKDQKKYIFENSIKNIVRPRQNYTI